MLRIKQRVGTFVLAAAVLALAAPAAHGAGRVRAGAAVLDGTYHVGNSAGQYASTRDEGYGDVDPHNQQVKNQASYGVQARESVRAIVIRGGDGHYVAIVSDDHYIPQDALWRRTAQYVSADTHGLINEKNLTMAVTHNHSSPSYSSFDWGVWSFQDVFDFRFFEYYARQNARAIEQALAHMHDVRVSATVSHFDAFQKNPMGPTWADDGSPAGFPRPYTDHDLSVIRFENVDRRGRPKPLATLVNIGQHPEDLEGYNLISGEYPAETERFVDRTAGGVTMLTQNATGTSEVEEDRWHPVHKREIFNHAQYTQLEWGARQLASAVIADIGDIHRQRPNSDRRRTPYGGTSYHDRFVPWMTSFPVAMDDRWFPGTLTRAYPSVSSCRTDPAFQGDPRLPVAGLPDCVDMPWGTSLEPVTTLGGASPGISTDTFEQLGIPIPETYSAPSNTGLEDTYGVHMQAYRLGPILVTVCSCEQWVEQSYNIKTRTDRLPGNEYVGYDATSPRADPSEKCTRNADGTHKDDGSGSGTWTCSLADLPADAVKKKFSDHLIEHMRAQVLNDAAGWDDPSCSQLGCGAQAESEPTDLKKVFGNFTHDDTTARGGRAQGAGYAQRYGYKLVVTMAMANDYNGYIASYREFMDRDHYRKALTGWGPHSSDYFATRLTQMGHALNGDAGSRQAIDEQTDVSKAPPKWKPLVTKETADQAHEEAKVKAIGDVAAQGVKAYASTIPNDGGSARDLRQPYGIHQFDTTAFTWAGGNNYTDNPVVTVQRRVRHRWVEFADQSGEVPVTLRYPASSTGDYDPAAVARGQAGYRLGGQVWKWTASFEAFVSRFPLVDPQGHAYRATPFGMYRFVVHGLWHKGGADRRYTRVSKAFHLDPWKGIKVTQLRLDRRGHVRFAAGPTHHVREKTVRSTARPPFNKDDRPVPFTIGPVDYPDSAKDDWKRTGARFLDALRGYSGTSPANVEHYCLDCTFRPWLDTTARLRAKLTIKRRHHRRKLVERLRSDSHGRFRSHRRLRRGDWARIMIYDAWGDRTHKPGKRIKRAR